MSLLHRAVLVAGTCILVAFLVACPALPASARRAARTLDPDAESVTGRNTQRTVDSAAEPVTAFLHAEALGVANAEIARLEAEAAAAAAAAAATEAAAAAAAVPPPFPSDEWWLRVGRCEQPDGKGGIVWTTHGRNQSTGVMFVGGLGIMEAAWNQYDVYGFGPGWLASPEQQMTIARDIFARNGPGAWSCSRVAGEPF